jgi:hypothetical protein
MAGTISDIEGLLTRSRTPPINVLEKELTDQIALLPAEDAKKLVERILSRVPGDRVPEQFQWFHTAIRQRLFLRLIERMGPYNADQLLARLTAPAPSPADAALQTGLFLVFGSGKETERTAVLRFLRASAAAPPPVPSISLVFRNDPAQKLSADNKCRSAGVILNLGPDRLTGLNAMEIQGTLSAHDPRLKYEFRRGIERSMWFRKGPDWLPQEDDDHVGPGADDDKTNRDEFLTPSTFPSHIYVIDRAGFAHSSAGAARMADEAVYMMNAVESAWVNVSGRWLLMRSLCWCTSTWLERYGKGGWRRKADRNLIEEGRIRGLNLRPQKGRERIRHRLGAVIPPNLAFPRSRTVCVGPRAHFDS